VSELTLDHAAPAGRVAVRELRAACERLAAREHVWRPLLRFDPDARWYTRLATAPGWEAWLLTWLPGQATGPHDHGGSAGAFRVLQGLITERTPIGPVQDGAPVAWRRRVLVAGSTRSFGPDHVHDVATGTVPAVSLHVYGPALERMTRWDVDRGGRLVRLGTERAGADW
jgi:predicted metal-dependent enzyme (double-stranded beta helix superfamily)